MTRAMTPASSWGPGQSTRVTPASASSGGASPGRRAPVAAGLSAASTRAARAAGAAGDAGARPFPDVAVRDTQMVEQPGHAELGMGGLQRLPRFVVGVPVQARQHHASPGQAGHRLEQVGGGGDAAGGAGGDDGPLRRRLAPGVRLGPEKQVAAHHGVDAALLGEDGGPAFGDDPEEPQGDPPVVGELFGHQVGEGVETEPFGVHLIEQPGQFGGQTGGLVRRRAPSLEGEHQPGQQQVSAQAGNFRGNPYSALRPAAGRLPQPGEDQFVLVHVAKRRQPRQQQGPAAALAQEGLAQGAAGAPGGEENGGLGQGLGPAADPGVETGGQGVDEGYAGGNAIDGRSGRAFRRRGAAHRRLFPAKRART